MTDAFSHIAPERRAEADILNALFCSITGWQPKLWGKVVGYGAYHYRTKAGREDVFFATGFNIRVRDIALHILPGYSDFPQIAARLGPHKRGRSCWYFKSLKNVDHSALADLIKVGLDDLAQFHEVYPDAESCR